MAIDFSTLVYLPNFDFWSREATITPVVSAPAAAAYTVRGIYTTRPVQIVTDVGVVVMADHETIFDIRDHEFADFSIALPVQGDQITIPASGNIPAEGDFEVTDAQRNGGGETTLVIRKYEPAAP